MASSLFKMFLPHSNRLKYIGPLINGLSVTKGPSCSVSSIASFYLFVLILWCTLSDLLSSIELSSTIMISGYPSSIEQTCDKCSSARISFDSLSSESQTCDIVICCMPVISVLQGSTCKLKTSALIPHLEICLAR